jgi:protein-disulfide isomerase
MIRDRDGTFDRQHLGRRKIQWPGLDREGASRRSFVPWRAVMSAACIGVFAGLTSHAARATDHKAKAIAAEQPAILSLKDALLHDAASPVIGNPDGDVTIVAFVDYNCPYCKKSEADLDALLASDPKIRVIYKDFPILAKSSVAAAKVAIASAWQGKYAEVHRALMRMNARPATDSDISMAVVSAGVDVTRLNRDLDRRDGEIVALLKRNIAEADALKLKGTPVYLIGPFITATPLDFLQFKKIIADTREDQAKPQSQSQSQSQ